MGFKKVDKVNFDFMLIMVSCAGCLFLVKTQCLFHLDSAGLEYLLMSLTFSARGSKRFIQPKETQTHLLSVELFYLHCLLPFGLISQAPALHSNSFLFMNMYIVTP